MFSFYSCCCMCQDFLLFKSWILFCCLCVCVCVHMCVCMYIHATFYPLNLQMDPWVVYTFWLLWIMLLWAWIYKYLFEFLLSILWVIYLQVELPDHIVLWFEISLWNSCWKLCATVTILGVRFFERCWSWGLHPHEWINSYYWGVNNHKNELVIQRELTLTSSSLFHILACHSIMLWHNPHQI
jgi:hypothetical protein